MSPATIRTDETATASRARPSATASPVDVVPVVPASAAGTIRRAAPTAIIVVLLGLIALWGHANDWTLPRFSALVVGDGAAVEDWCDAHNVPESECIECNVTLAPLSKDHGWCKRHGVMQCPFEHPEVAQIKNPPTITQADLARADRAMALMPRPENNSRCPLHERRIQFASLESLEKSGVEPWSVGRQPIAEVVVANGEVVYDETRQAHLASRVAGTVVAVERQVGDLVKKGDVLALVDAAEVGRAKANFLQAISTLRLKRINVDRLKPLAEEGTIPDRQYREASAALQDAQIKLIESQQTLGNLGLPVEPGEFASYELDEVSARIQHLGLPAESVDRYEGAVSSSNLLPLRAPLDGVVVERDVVAGEVVDDKRSLFVVADVRRLWLTLNVRQDDAKYVAIGQPVLFRPSESGAAAEIRGEVNWISTSADDQTRTVKVRAELPNPDGRLRANTFGTGQIVLRAESDAIVVPNEAIHWDGGCHVVFVRDKNFFDPAAPKFFHVRNVRIGVRQGDMTEIIAGVLPGEVVASKNSVVLESQLLKNNLGAGCGCAHGH